MKSYGFKNRLFFVYALITIVLVVLFAVLLIAFTASRNHETELVHQREAFLSGLAQVETLLEQANRLAAQVASNNEILGRFIQLNETKSVGDKEDGFLNYFDDHLLDAIRMSSLLEDINGVDAYADRISVFNKYSDYVSTGKLYETMEIVHATLGETAWIQTLTDEITSRERHFLILEIQTDCWSNNPNIALITLYRTLSYTDTSTPYGLVGVQLNSERLTGLSFWGNDSEYMIIDDRNPKNPVLLYPIREDISLDTLYPALAEQLEHTSITDKLFSQTTLTLSGADVIVMAARPVSSNWLLVRALPVSALSKPYQRLYVVMALACLIFLALLLVFVNLIAERVSKPLRNLSSAISGIGLMNMQLPERQYATRELAALDESFREMLARIKKSVSLEMQAYMRVLQAQMNPHFLYNTLSVVIASSESAGDDRTASMCLKLTSMFRYVADVSRESVKVSDEIAYAKNYLDLMKERYEDLFTYELNISDEASNVILPRLIIQPLAENCFTHGFKNAPPWFIRVEVRADENRWELSVEDNGVGMTDDEIAELVNKLEMYKKDVAGSYQNLTMGGMGLINTLLRLMLMYNSSIAYKIDIRPEGGLIIRISQDS